MCAQQLLPAWNGAGKLEAPTRPAARLELLHARRRAWTIPCQRSQARLCTDPLPVNSHSSQPARAAWLPAISWGLRGEAWICAALKRAAKVFILSVWLETPSHHLCTFRFTACPLPKGHDAMSRAAVVPLCSYHQPKSQQHRGASHT